MGETIVVVLIFMAAGVIQGLTGFGAAMVAMPLLSFVIGIKEAVPLCILNGLAITLYLSLALRRDLCWGRIGPLLLGSLPGIALGIALLQVVATGPLKFFLGIVIVLHCAYSLARRPQPRAVGTGWGYAAGFLTGFISGAVSAGGPPVVIYATLTTWSRDQIKATLSGFFFVSGVATAMGHALGGLTTGRVLLLSGLSIPALLPCVWLGARWADGLSRERYVRMVQALLLALGGGILVQALTELLAR